MSYTYSWTEHSLAVILGFSRACVPDHIDRGALEVILDVGIFIEAGCKAEFQACAVMPGSVR